MITDAGRAAIADLIESGGSVSIRCRVCGAELAPDLDLAELHVCRIVIA